MEDSEIIIGEKIRLIRKERRITLRDLADGICSLGKMSNIENGKASPTPEELEALAKKLRVSVKDLNLLPFTNNLNSMGIMKNWFRRAKDIEDLFQLGFYIEGKMDLEEFSRDSKSVEELRILNLFLQAWYYKVTNDKENCISILKDIIHCETLWEWQTLIQIRATFMLSYLYLLDRDFDASGELLKKLREQVVGNRNDHGSEAWKLRFNTSILLIVQGDYDLARLYIEVSSKESDNEGLVTYLLAMLAYVNYEWSKSTELVYKAKEIFRNSSNDIMLLKAMIAEHFIQYQLSNKRGIQRISRNRIKHILVLVKNILERKINLSVYCLNILLDIAMENNYDEEILEIKQNLLNVLTHNVDAHLAAQSYLCLSRAAKYLGDSDENILKYVELGLETIRNKYSFLYGHLLFEKAKIIEKEVSSLFEESAKYFVEASNSKGLMALNIIYIMPEFVI